MLDVSPAKVFKSSAFAPTDEELTKHAEAERRRHRQLHGKGRAIRRTASAKIREPSASPPGDNAFDENDLEDSDDDLPDVSTMLDKRPAKRRKEVHESEDDVRTLSPLSYLLKLTDGFGFGTGRNAGYHDARSSGSTGILFQGYR